MIRVVIADDEKPARGRVASFLAEYPEMELIGEAVSGEETVKLVDSKKPDLLFLDIQMPKGNGFEVLVQLTAEPVVIFTTAYDEYAIEAFNVHALDYLLKPFSKERFRRSVALVKRILNDPAEYNERTREALSELSGEPGYLRRVSVKRNHVYAIVPVEDILAVRTIDGLVYIQTDEEEFQTDTTLNQFERRLDPEKFMRVHRTAIINLERVDKIMPWGQGRFAVGLENGGSVQVSRERLPEFKRKMGLKL